MTALAHNRRKWTATMLAAGVATLVGAGGLVYAGANALVHYRGARNELDTLVKVPSTPVGMLATVDDADALTSVTLLVLKPDSLLGGSIVSVPVSVDTAGGLNGLRVPLTQVYAEGGDEALSVAVESVLSITLDHSLVADAEQVAGLLEPVSPLPVDLPAEVTATVDGAPKVLFPAGPRDLRAEQVAQVLNARTDAQLERSRRATIDAIWKSVAAAAGEGVTAAVAGSPVTSFGELVTHLFAGPVRARGLSAVPLTAAENPNDLDVDALDRAEAVMVLATVAPSAMSAPAPGLVFRVEAPPGYEERVKFAVRALLFVGGNVQSVFLDAEPVGEKSVMYIYDNRLEDEAAKQITMFGDLEFGDAEPGSRIEGIDAVLVLGMQFLKGGDDVLPSTTTSTTEAG